MRNQYEVQGETTTIFLRRADGTILTTLIDTSDLVKVSAADYWWSIWCEDVQSFYCCGHIARRRMLLHRHILVPERQFVVDHINHDTLDNRRSNLRVVSGTINQLNRSKAASHSQSGILGVSLDKRSNRWNARIGLHGKRLHIGMFASAAEAQRAVEAKRTEIMADLLKDARHAP